MKVVPGIHSGHRMRVRQRAESEGIGGFKPHELVELLLFYCVPRRDVNELAHQVVNAAGSVGNLLAHPESAQGVLPARAVEFLAALGRAVSTYQALPLDARPLLNNYTATREFLEVRLARQKDEPGLWLITMDAENRVISVSFLTDEVRWATPETTLAALRILMLEHTRNAFLIKTGCPADQYDREQVEHVSRSLIGMGVRLLDFISMAGGTQSLYLDHEFVRAEFPKWDDAVAQSDFSDD